MTDLPPRFHKTTYLNVVVRKGATVFKLLTSKDETLLVRRNTLLVLNFGLDIVDSVGGFDLEGDGLACQGLDEDLHSATEAEDQVEGRLLLNVTADVSARGFIATLER